MKKNIKKSLKIVYLILILSFCVKIIALGVRIYTETKTDSWYIFIYKNKTLEEQRTMIKKSGWKEVGIEHGKLLVNAPGIFEGDALGMCKVQFWKDGNGSKTVLNHTIYDPECKPVRNEYVNDHPVLFYIITGRGIF